MILEIIESAVCKPIVITRVYHRVCLVCVEPTELKTSEVSFYYCCGNSNLRATLVFIYCRVVALRKGVTILFHFCDPTLRWIN